jgi:pyruvate,orthophosphate dikinase
MTQQWVYFFGETGKKDKFLVGGKGANLSEMTKIGLPIPQGYTVSMACSVEYGKDNKVPAGFLAEEAKNLARLEKVSGKKLGDKTNPLLVSVRSGSAFSMPGMMDTVLNLGLNDEIVEVLGQKSGMRFAYDSYRRFIMMFGDVVKNVHREKFDKLLWDLKTKKGYKNDTEMTADDLKWLCGEFKNLYKASAGEPFPMDPRYQLTEAITAVFRSWNNPRAIKYRDLYNIDHNIGTAVNVQEMVYGNMGDDCATGVAFTRNPSTGENKRYGEFLPNAQGEDVVAGVRTPIDLDDMKKTFPQASKELFDIFTLLENHYADMQDIEFTVEKHKLYILQTRNGKRTAGAAVKMAVDMVEEKRISKEAALLRLDAEQIDTLLHPQLDSKATKEATPMGKGLPASPGAAVGQVFFTADHAVAAKEAGKKVILVRTETSPEDITGMTVSQGILTSRGGMTSHAAVVARGMNLPCICGASDVVVDEHAKTFTCGGKTYKEGDFMSLDGNTGAFYFGQLPVQDAKLDANFHKILQWARDASTMEVRANADTPHDAQVARGFGAQGIGLCRTEHMFFGADRILPMREMIVAEDKAAREKALAKLLPIQRADFHGILGEMSGLPVIIRLIDPPLHEFLPHEEKEQQEVANQVAGGDINVIKKKVAALHEFNPMLGFRGCRLGVVFPEINAMQVRAIFEASLALLKEGKKPWPQIEVPLVGHVKELKLIKDMIKQIAKDTGAEGKVHYEVGTMIEVPRAALRADELATEAEFMSFGTNDLTQMTCGFSRDDSGVFLKEYVAKKIYKRDPFAAVDQDGVGRLMQLCVSLARDVNPKIDIGICGEHGGEPSSVEFCHRIGLSNVSCSPYRVPIAQIAAAQAAIKYGPPVVKSTCKIFQSIPAKL